jgi:hypothetical protein
MAFEESPTRKHHPFEPITIPKKSTALYKSTTSFTTFQNSPVSPNPLTQSSRYNHHKVEINNVVRPQT